MDFVCLPIYVDRMKNHNLYREEMYSQFLYAWNAGVLQLQSLEKIYFQLYSRIVPYTVHNTSDRSQVELSNPELWNSYFFLLSL